MAASTLEVGKKLVAYCKQMKWADAVNELYSPDIVSVEAIAMGNMPQTVKGIDAVRAKTEAGEEGNTVHGGTTEGPWPHGDRFIVRFTLDITPKGGPMAGKRFTIDETGLYTVKDGKVVHEEFFYCMGE